VRGSVNRLYRIRLSADAPERVDSVDIRHVDIQLSFKNALVFYDNIPGLDTALLIVGQGGLTFSPSDPSEAHQLVLTYKSPRLEDTISYAYIRCSPSFFGRNVTIRKAAGAVKPVTLKERDLAASLFRKLSANYFTIQTPLTDEALFPRGRSLRVRGAETVSSPMSYTPPPRRLFHDRARDGSSTSTAGPEEDEGGCSPLRPEEQLRAL
jgi:hypothetical protein